MFIREEDIQNPTFKPDSLPFYSLYVGKQLTAFRVHPCESVINDLRHVLM